MTDQKPETSPTPAAKQTRPRRRMVTKVSEGDLAAAAKALDTAAAKPPKDQAVIAAFARIRPRVEKLKAHGHAESDIVELLAPHFAGMTIASFRYLMKKTEKLAAGRDLGLVADQRQTAGVAQVNQAPGAQPTQPAQPRAPQDQPAQVQPSQGQHGQGIQDPRRQGATHAGQQDPRRQGAPQAGQADQQRQTGSPNGQVQVKRDDFGTLGSARPTNPGQRTPQ